jgi:isopentenyl-diphosphate delta-isomerase
VLYGGASDAIRRKVDHIHVALHEDVEFHTLTTGLERYRLPYEALPEINRDEVDTSITLFGKRLSMPLIISPMTGGTDEAAHYNRLLAEAAQEFGLGFGVGSQRVAIENPSLADTFDVRKVAPDILLFANLGAVQLNNGWGVDECVEAVEMIQADVLTLHLNPLQECIQPGGNTNFEQLSERIGEVCEVLDVPVVAKEVGHGISKRTAKLLVDAGVAGIDVAGAGGTSWAKVESLRSYDEDLGVIGTELGEWGIPTAESLIEVRAAAPYVTVIAGGGIRTGEDIAKSLALGADAVGMALPLLRCAAESREALHKRITQLREELVTIMFCASLKDCSSLKTCSLIKAQT